MLPVYGAQSDWPQYAGDEGGSRYSHLDQINRENIKDLEVAWTYKTGHLDRVPEERHCLSQPQAVSRRNT